jgi:CheY-like chemotaxis protein
LPGNCAGSEFSITSAHSGEDGTRLARQRYFKLVILDVMLPRMRLSGKPVARKALVSESANLSLIFTYTDAGRAGIRNQLICWTEAISFLGACSSLSRLRRRRDG